MPPNTTSWRDWLPLHCVLCEQLACSPVCTRCEATFKAFSNHCLTCSRTIIESSSLCGHCLNSPSSLDGLYIALCFENKVRELVLAAKFSANRAALAHMSKQLLNLTIPKAQVIIPMPISLPRLAKRGYNQTNFLAQALAKHHNIKIDKTLLHKSDRQPQSLLPARVREKNILGAFSAARKINGTVLLVDDIYTTGATLQEAARTLKNAGADRVFAAVFAATVFD